jgi:hypothetical protein
LLRRQLRRRLLLMLPRLLRRRRRLRPLLMRQHLLHGAGMKTGSGASARGQATISNKRQLPLLVLLMLP